MKANEILIYLSLKYKGQQKDIYNAIKAKEAVHEEEVEKIAAPFLDRVITVIDRDYPDGWKQLRNPSIVSFYEGDRTLLQSSYLRRSVTYVGSRDASGEGKRIAREMGRGLAKEGVLLISGLARGIDGEVMRGAMEGKGKIIGISGAGIDIDYPAQNRDIYDYIRKNGLLLSEFPPGVRPHPEFFPQRNRLLAGLGAVIIVGEAERRSGSLITANIAIEQGKDIGAIPTSPFKESGTNALIKDGAYLIDELEDILALLPKSEKL